MRRIAIVVALAILGALYLYSAFAPDRSRGSPPFKIGSVRRLLHGFLGVVLLLGVLFLIYAALMSGLAED